jgi:hypothetical protein
VVTFKLPNIKEDRIMPDESKRRVTLEESSYVKGVYDAFQQQKHEYTELTAKLMQLEARIVLAEKQMKLARDHLSMVVERTPGALPTDWKVATRSVRFVGLRLADACIAVLRENGAMTLEGLMQELNDGMYRWRTSSPAREVNAALLRQPNVKRVDDKWVYGQMSLGELPKTNNK